MFCCLTRGPSARWRWFRMMPLHSCVARRRPSGGRWTRIASIERTCTPFCARRVSRTSFVRGPARPTWRPMSASRLSADYPSRFLRSANNAPSPVSWARSTTLLAGAQGVSERAIHAGARCAEELHPRGRFHQGGARAASGLERRISSRLPSQPEPRRRWATRRCSPSDELAQGAVDEVASRSQPGRFAGSGHELVVEDTLVRFIHLASTWPSRLTRSPPADAGPARAFPVGAPGARAVLSASSCGTA